MVGRASHILELLVTRGAYDPSTLSPTTSSSLTTWVETALRACHADAGTEAQLLSLAGVMVASGNPDIHRAVAEGKIPALLPSLLKAFPTHAPLHTATFQLVRALVALDDGSRKSESGAEMRYTSIYHSALAALPLFPHDPTVLEEASGLIFDMPWHKEDYFPVAVGDPNPSPGPPRTANLNIKSASPAIRNRNPCPNTDKPIRHLTANKNSFRHLFRPFFNGHLP